MEPTDLEHRHLRSALEFAVLMVNEGRKRRPPLPFPAAMKRFLSLPRLPTSALGSLRRIIEGDDVFRQRLAAGAVPELVDPIGILWYTRPEGWHQQIADLVAEAEAAETEAGTAVTLRREQRRREAAEQAAARSRAQVVGLEERIAGLRAELDEQRAAREHLERSLATVRAELVQARLDARHAGDRAAAAATRLDQLAAEQAATAVGRPHAEAGRGEPRVDRVELRDHLERLERLAVAARQVAVDLEAATGELGDRLGGGTDAEPSGQPGPSSESAAVPTVRQEPDGTGQRRSGTERSPTGGRRGRRPLALPGGIVGDTHPANLHLLRSGASILVDGYNASMTGWPQLSIADQRRVLLDLTENLARRYAADITVVFDGADVGGAATDRRRLVRVVFSPDGVPADDVLRDEVARLPAGRPVVVVTADAEVVRTVRALGANTISSTSFLATARG